VFEYERAINVSCDTNPAHLPDGMGMGGRVSDQGPHKQVQMHRVKARFSHFKRVYYNLEGVPAPDPLRVAELRKRKYSLRRWLS
jgi:hypothetical protein